MKLNTFKSDFILFFVASIWGLAFVAQRIGMDHVGPFTFNAFRFALGSASLLPVILFSKTKKQHFARKTDLVKAGFYSGIFLFCGISLQQIGLVYTTAGKAGFITGLYVVIVPFIGIFLKQEKTSLNTWTGAILAAFGMFLLSVTKDLSINKGDFLILLSAVCFAFHLIVIGRLSNKFNTARLSLVQCIFCTFLSFCFAFIFENIVMQHVYNTIVPILYGGIFSVGVAYSLQIYGQRNSPAAHAAIIFSLESVVAAFCGWLILNELLTKRGMIGCSLMLAGMVISQLDKFKKNNVSLGN